VNPQLPKSTRSRCISVRVLRTLPSDKVEDFRYVDDATFFALRRKCARWAADNFAALKDACPTSPPGFHNRLRMNWHFLLATADLAGGDWPKAARAAAVKLARERRDPSETQRLVAKIYEFFAKHGPDLPSADIRRWLAADPTGEWASFRGRGPISERQIAILLDNHDIDPCFIHPKGRTERGYRVEQFETAFRHYLRKPPPCKRATVRKRRGK
jgi:hypothetical protein